MSICIISSVHSQLFAFLKNFPYSGSGAFLAIFFCSFWMCCSKSKACSSTLIHLQDRAFGTIEAIQLFPYHRPDRCKFFKTIGIIRTIIWKQGFTSSAHQISRTLYQYLKFRAHFISTSNFAHSTRTCTFLQSHWNAAEHRLKSRLHYTGADPEILEREDQEAIKF